MSKRDYYEILGVSRESSGDEIKKAYRKMAMKYHPDRNPGDAEAETRFKEAAEAYEVLRDPQRRSRYDQFGHSGLGNGGGFQGFSSAEDIFSAFSDIFGDFFGFAGTGRRGPRPQAGSDLRYNLKIGFREAARGTEVDLKIPKRTPCPECQGSGAEPGHAPETCSHCGGRGQVVQSQGFFRIAVTCPACQGEGQVVTHPCSKCKGRGSVQETKKIQVRVPAGVDNGSRLRLRGEGEPGEYGGPPGDLYVVILVEEDEVFERQGQDLLFRTTINFVQASLGGKIEIPTLEEPVPMEIPKGTQSGEIFKLKGLGLPHPGSRSTGDLLIEVTVATPRNLTKRQEELLREFAQIEAERPKSKVKNFFKRAMGD